MRARIEAAQRRRAQRSVRRIIGSILVVIGLGAAFYVLRERPPPRPVVIIPGDPTTGWTAELDPLLANPQAGGQAGVASDSRAAAGSSGSGGKVYYFTGPEDKPEKHELLDEPIPADCHPEQHADYDGRGISWGLTDKAPSAAACCARCKEKAGPPDNCNAWVWCGDPSGICWTPDLWNHTTGACWLKHQDGWDGNTDLAATNLKVNARGDYSAEYRSQHKTAPEKVAWTAGLIAAGTG